jgi:hypothetical protein
MNPQRPPAANRAVANRRTVLWLAVVAVAIYAAFILSGVFGVAGGAAP